MSHVSAGVVTVGLRHQDVNGLPDLLHTTRPEAYRPRLMTEPSRQDPDPGDASDHAYRLIRAQVLSGERRGGEWLREGELAESLGVSRTPVREALRRLTAEGLVRYERHRGVQVHALTERDVEEIFDLRSVLEPWGSRLAALSGTVDVDTLDGLAHDMDAAAAGSRPDVDRITELNNRFHTLVLEGARNRRLAALVSSVVEVPVVWQTFSRYSGSALRRSLAHHHELVDALRARDPEWAESVMRSHVRAARTSLRHAVPPAGA